MRLSSAFLTLLAASSPSLSSPVENKAEIASRNAKSENGKSWTGALHLNHLSSRDLPSINILDKRRGGGGGGGGGGRGGGGSSSGSSSGGSSSGSSSGGSSSGSKGGGSSGSGSGSSSGSRSGTSSSPTYGGGVYSGGSSTPYRAGSRSPSGITPFLVGGAGLGLLAASWPHGAYIYGWHNPYHYHNNSNNRNETLPVECLCDPSDMCGCDEMSNSTSFLDSVVYPNGTSKNESVAKIQNVNGTQTLVINGTLENDTDSSTSGNSAVGMYLLSTKAVLDAAIAGGLVTGLLVL